MASNSWNDKNPNRKTATGKNHIMPGGSDNTTFDSYVSNAFLATGPPDQLFTRLANLISAQTGGVDITKISKTDQKNLEEYFKTLAATFSGGAQTQAISSATQSSAFSPHTAPFIFSIQNNGKSYPGPAKFYTNQKKINSEQWVLPVPPADFSVSVPGSPTVLNTISGNQFTHAGNLELDEISFSGFFPFLDTNSRYPLYVPDYVQTLGYHTPADWIDNLVTAFRSNQPLKFCVYASASRSGNGVTSASHNMVVQPSVMSVTAFDWKMGSLGGNRKDIEYNITLKMWKEQKIEMTNFVKAYPKKQPISNPDVVVQPGGVSSDFITPGATGFFGPSNTTTTGGNNVGSHSDRPDAPQLRIYTVKSGDTLTKIAQKYLKDGLRYKEIYNLNKKVIGPDKNKIKVGQKLRLPRR